MGGRIGEKEYRLQFGQNEETRSRFRGLDLGIEGLDQEMRVERSRAGEKLIGVKGDEVMIWCLNGEGVGREMMDCGLFGEIWLERGDWIEDLG